MTLGKPTQFKYNYVPFLLILFIDSIFFYKYGSRITDFILLLTLAYILLKLLIAIAGNYFKNETLVYLLIILYILSGIFILNRINTETLNVDRWDAIVKWWDAFFIGKFPYAARTRFNGFPSPLPFLQFIYLPFYLAGEIGWLNILALVSFLIFIRKYKKDSYLMVTLALITSTALWWELCVRSTLFVNSILLLGIVLLISRQTKSVLKLMMVGFLTGLIVSTRLISIIPLVAVCTFIFLRPFKLKTFLLFSTMTGLGFALTFLILLPWDLAQFWANNPFLHHDRHMPRIFTFVFILGAFFIGWFAKSIYQLIFLSGILLFFIAAIFVSLEIYTYGFELAYLGSKGDISYFILSFAFLMYSLSGKPENKHPLNQQNAE